MPTKNGGKIGQHKRRGERETEGEMDFLKKSLLQTSSDLFFVF